MPLNHSENNPFDRPTQSTLFVVATPIGNLSDLSPRALGVLQGVDLVLCEDTRRLRTLASACHLRLKAWQAYHDHNERKSYGEIIDRMKQSVFHVALTSDGGTPCISDPGYHLTKAAHEAGIPVTPIPGPSALLALLSASGLPNDRFVFVGFAPRKAAEMKSALDVWAKLGMSIIFYESNLRIVKTLEYIAERYPDAQIALGRELTKRFESIKLACVVDLVKDLKAESAIKGEICCVLSLPHSAYQPQQGNLSQQVTEALEQFGDSKAVLKHFLSKGYARSEIYDLILEARRSETIAPTDDDTR
jgi:16S rRNA (cytidine1402-2'-O)-methyltransferase